MATWQRRSGRITAQPEGARRIPGFLDGAGVIARIHHDPLIDDGVSLTVLINDEGYVAVIDDDDRSLAVLGPTLAELTEALTQESGGEVWFEGLEDDEAEAEDNVAVAAESDEPDEQPEGERPDGESVNGSPGDDAEPQKPATKRVHKDPFNADFDVSDAYVPDRAVLFSRRDPREIVDNIGATMWAEPHLDGHLMYANGVVIRPEYLATGPDPILLAQRGAAYPSVSVVGEDRINYTWDIPRQLVPRDVTGPAEAMVQQMLGEGATVGALMTLFPAVEPSQLRSSVSGPRSGLRATVRALGLPHRVSKFLHHERDVADLDGLREIEPRGRAYAWSQAVSGRAREAQESVSVHLGGAADQVRHAAENVRNQAEATFDAGQTFTEEVILPARRSWVAPTVAAAEIAVGAVAICHMAQRWKQGKLRGRDITAGVVGVVALADAAVNVLIFATSRRARRRS